TPQAWRQAAHAGDAIADRLRTIESAHDVSLVTEFNGSTLTDGEVKQWLRLVEEAATAVSAVGVLVTVTHGSVATQIAPRLGAGQSRFAGPPMAFNPWERIIARLEQKRAQASGTARGVWLRVDFIDGIWQFSPWGNSPLHEKLMNLEQHLVQRFR